MDIIWTNLAIQERYVTGDQWGPLLKLFTQNYEIHLHLNATGTAVNHIGTVRNIQSGIRLNNAHYANDVNHAGGQPFVPAPAAPTLIQGNALLGLSAGSPTTYHQWLRREQHTNAAWTLGCGRAQQARMRLHKPPYQSVAQLGY